MSSNQIAEKVFKTISRLPKPLATYSRRGAVFEVYRVKDLFKNSWPNSGLRNLLIAARRSYDRYGERPPLDRQDEKAAIYLVRARYEAKGFPAEEWLSVRMVPGDGRFLGLKEPEIFYYHGKPIDYLLKKHIKPKSEADFWRRFASSSRMCGIHPFYKNGKRGDLPESHKYTAICFSLVHAQFLIDYPFKTFPYQYITATIRPDLLHKGLAVKTKNKKAFPFFLPAYRFLGINQKHVRVDREVYAYDFPSYWLNLKQMKAVARSLIKSKKMTDRAYLKKPSELITKPPQDLRMKRKELLKIISERVDDVTELKVTPAKAWYQGIHRVLTTAGIKVPKFKIAMNGINRRT